MESVHTDCKEVSLVGDVSDQAEQLSEIMQSEAVRGFGEGDAEGLEYPLEDLDELIASEDADDSSDDPFHAGGDDPAQPREPWIPAEQAAMHIVEGDDTGEPDEGDPEDLPQRTLTPEDETLLGIDPYE